MMYILKTNLTYDRMKYYYYTCANNMYKYLKLESFKNWYFFVSFT